MALGFWALELWSRAYLARPPSVFTCITGAPLRNGFWNMAEVLLGARTVSADVQLSTLELVGELLRWRSFLVMTIVDRQASVAVVHAWRRGWGYIRGPWDGTDGGEAGAAAGGDDVGTP